MNNCFTYTYKRLRASGYKVPTAWDAYTVKDMRMFILKQEWFLANKKHYAFFESFCSYVDKAKEDDIIINDSGVGVAVNKFKYMTIRDKNNEAVLCDIAKEDKILRVNNG